MLPGPHDHGSSSARWEGTPLAAWGRLPWIFVELPQVMGGPAVRSIVRVAWRGGVGGGKRLKGLGGNFVNAAEGPQHSTPNGDHQRKTMPAFFCTIEWSANEALGFG